MNVPGAMAAKEKPPARPAAAREQPVHVVLAPLSHPELGEIRIDEGLFAIGRTEQPFASYEGSVAAAMSRRHARIFCERGAAYVADLASKNGTTVNGVAVRQKPQQLRSGDELRFGGDLAYRVELVVPPEAPVHAPAVPCLTLMPERTDLGLQPIVITRFPFLVSKADEAFARYRDSYPHQVNYVSRRHAHIFLKGGAPFVEDLSSTNGTFVDGKRLDEHATALVDGSLLAFGGTHFVYRVRLQEAAESTLTRLAPPGEEGAPAADIDKTTFVAAADSFLDIFCVDTPPPADTADAADGEAGEAAAPAARPRPRWVVFLAELRSALGGGERRGPRRGRRWVAVAVAVLGALAVWTYLAGTPQREMAGLLARGEFAAAAATAHAYLASHPEDAEVRALATEALMRAEVPGWMAALEAGSFDRAGELLTGMQAQAAANPDAQGLIGALAAIGDLQRFVAERGGLEAPVPVYAADDPLGALIRRWKEDPGARQRAFTRLAAFVPAFQDLYAQALSRLRKLESDDALYRAAIERLKGTIRARLDDNDAAALETVFDEYAQKYPRLTGLDALRADLARYLALERDTRSGSRAALAARFEDERFATPAFREAAERLGASRLLAPEALEQERAATLAGRPQAGTPPAVLRALADGAARAAVAEELARKPAQAGGDRPRRALLELSGDPEADVLQTQLALIGGRSDEGR